MRVWLHVGELKGNEDKNNSNLQIPLRKTVELNPLLENFSFLFISQPFSSFPRREMTCFASLWTTHALKDNFSLKKKVRSPDLQTAQTNLISESFEYNMSTSSTNSKLFQIFENYCRLG